MSRLRNRINRWLCNKFDHKWSYYKTQDSPAKEFRCCSRCKSLQDYRVNILASQGDGGWYSLVRWTKKGAAKHFKNRVL